MYHSRAMLCTYCGGNGYVSGYDSEDRIEDSPCPRCQFEHKKTTKADIDLALKKAIEHVNKIYGYKKDGKRK